MSVEEKIRKQQEDYTACTWRIRDLRNRKWSGKLTLEFKDGKILWMEHKPEQQEND